MKTSIGWLLVACVATSLFAAEKIRVTSQDQLPRYHYAFEGKATEVITDDATYAKLASAHRADLEKLLADYDIADRTTLQGVLGALMSLDLNDGNYDRVLERVAQMRALEEKPAAKLTIGLLAEAYVETRKSGDFSSEKNFREAFAKTYAAKLAGLPWDVVGDSIKSTKASAEIVSPGLLLGQVESAIQPGVDIAKSLSGEVAQSLLNASVTYRHYLPLKEERIAVLTDYVKQHTKEKVDRWSERLVTLEDSIALTPVTIAVWDSGVDVAVFPKQLWVNQGETVDGQDNDTNGFVDDVNGIAFDLESNRVTELVQPLTAEQQAAYPTMRNHTKGMLDLRANIDSVEASDLKRYLSTLKPEDVRPFIENVGLFGNFTHGTHVAGIAVEGNPAARLMVARITFDHKMIPAVPTLEQTQRDAAAMRETVAYLRANGARVVNMSWGGTPRDIEAAFEANGAGGTPDERRKTAREYYLILHAAAKEAMEAAPEVLFVVAAGNSNNDAKFDDTFPSGIDLPNILTVGAVDQAGEETSFSTFGPNVDVHANGFEVDSYLPGGERMRFSGTSMAAPNVANLAGKLIALEPKLTVDQVVSLIKLGAQRSQDGRVNLISPARSIDLLKAWQGLK
jgi:subtilisin family serine protease